VVAVVIVICTIGVVVVELSGRIIETLSIVALITVIDIAVVVVVVVSWITTRCSII